MPFLALEQKAHVTISMGVVNKEVEQSYDLAEFIHLADQNLYQAKRRGKNRYVLS